MQLTDWLIVVFVTAIALVLVDGVRRKLGERRSRVVVRLEKNLPAGDPDDDVLTRSELPNGGARTLPRADQSAPLAPRRQKSVRSPSLKTVQAGKEQNSVPVLMDAVELEEERIEHTNVFAGRDAAETFEADEFTGSSDEENEEEAMLGEQIADRSNQGYMDTRYQGRDDEDDYEEPDDDFEEEEEEEDEDLDDEDFDDEDDVDELPGDYDDEDDDFDDEDEDDEDFDDEEDDDLDDEDDDYDDEDDEDELEELGGYPEDEWGDEEPSLLADDYETEPVLLEGAYDKASGRFRRQRVQRRIEPGFGNDTGSFDEATMEEDFSAAMAPDPDEFEPEPQVTGRAQRELLREQTAAKQGSASEVVDGPQEVIIINVMARSGELLRGAELLPLLRQQGLRLGSMSIFHRHANQDGSGGILFSMANMVKPGTFDLASMETFTTPGVSFFLQLPNRQGNMRSFDQMLGTTTALRNALGAELKDENRSVFTRQTVEHCRQRIRDFELALLRKK